MVAQRRTRKEVGSENALPKKWSGPFKNLQKKKNTFSKTSMIFSHIFLSILINIGSFFIYCKNTNPILKYLVFVKKNVFFGFVHTP